jgi:Tol biopolymer transport system component
VTFRRHALLVAVLLLIALTVTGCRSSEVELQRHELLFCADQAVFLASIKPDGSAQIASILDLPEDSTCPAWSPDGQLALMYRFRDTKPTIQDSLSLIERNSGAVHRHYDLGPRDTEWSFRWLPDGVSLLFISARDYQGDQNYCDAFTARTMAGIECWQSLADIYLADIRLPDAAISFQRLTTSPTNRCDLAWSADGRKIAHTRGSTCEGGLVEPGEIEVLDLQTRDLATLMHGTTDDPNPSTINYSPMWSPDGETVLYSTWWVDEHREQLLVTDVESWETRSASPKGILEGYWSPDGSKVVWRTEHTLGITDLSTGESQEYQIPKNAQLHVGPSGWSADSLRFVWAQQTDQPDGSGLFILDIEAAEITTLASSVWEDVTWSPDGDWLAVSVITPVERDICRHGYQIEIHIAKPDGTNLHSITGGQQMCAVQRPPTSWMGYPDRHAAMDVHWLLSPAP